MEPSSCRILIVDDELSITGSLASFLGFQGFLCETATNGRTALEMVSRNHFDVVITDILMPEMDGITLTQKLSHQFPNLIIMVMTGYYDEKAMKSAIAAGAHEFIKKPFSLAEFDVRFQRMMRESKG
jgi:DNA-binding NtrC family response regulator